MTGRPATTRDAVLRLLPSADDPGGIETTWTARDLAAAIYAAGDPAKVRPTHTSAVRRALYDLRRKHLVNHTLRKASHLGFFWFKIPDDAIGRHPNHEPVVLDGRQELRLRLVKILGMTGSDHAGESANAIKAANDLLRQAGIIWEELFGR